MAGNPLVGVFKALSDPNRLFILRLLVSGERRVSAICDAMPHLSQPSVSRHLGVLRQAGLVNDRRDGKEVYYSLDACRLADCCGPFFAQFGLSFGSTESD